MILKIFANYIASRLVIQNMDLRQELKSPRVHWDKVLQMVSAWPLPNALWPNGITNPTLKYLITKYMQSVVMATLWKVFRQKQHRSPAVLDWETSFTFMTITTLPL